MRFLFVGGCNIAPVIRIAAAGDVHASEAVRERIVAAFAQVQLEADIVLLAGDLTTTGEVEQARVLADACRPLSIPIFAVLGNHDWHVGRPNELVAVLEEAGVRVLDRDWATCKIDESTLGVVGAKGFIGGFPGSLLADFGEPLLRRVYDETSREADSIARGLQELVNCDLRIVLLHYAPTQATLAGEPEGIYTFLGSDRLAAPIAAFGADLVLHGHAHAGSFKATIGSIPVYNVAVSVTGRNFWIFNLEGARDQSAVEVE